MTQTPSFFRSNLPVLTLLSVLTLSNAAVMARNMKVAQDIESADPDSTVNVIVSYNQPLNERHISRARGQGGVHRQTLPSINGAVFTMSSKAALALADDPEVAHVSPDRPVRAMLDAAWPTVNANIAYQYGFTGKGVTVAVMSSQGICALTISSSSSSPSPLSAEVEM